MIPLRDMDTIQIEITNHCDHRCSNCTRLVGHHEQPYFMDFEKFKEAVDSLIGYVEQETNHATLIGIMGGEPLLHPEFEKFSLYLHDRISPINCGLWTGLPVAKKEYNELICKVYGNIFLNDHTRIDVLHHPIMITGKSLGLNPYERDYFYHNCWVQNCWSAAINPAGAYFCEVAGALDLLFNNGSSAWEVDSDWWKKSPQKYLDQLTLCEYCGCSFPLVKRQSIDGKDDVSKDLIEKLLLLNSPKIDKCIEYQDGLIKDFRPTATYKDEQYRRKIADKYDMFLVNNYSGFQTPRMKVIGR
jgi:hypothetical protein